MKAAANNDPADGLPPMRRLANKVFIAACIVAVWAVVYPAPYSLCMALLAAFPVAAIVMVALSSGQLKLVNEASEVTTYTLMISLLTGGALAYRSVDITAMAWVGPALAAVVLALAFVAVVAWIDRPNLHRRMLLIYGLVGLLWGWGCADFANVLLDAAPKEIFRPEIASYSVSLGMNAGRSGGGGYSRHLVVGPWGPVTTTNDPVVPEALYRRAQDHDPICVVLGRGFFRAPWYRIEACDAVK